MPPAQATHFLCCPFAYCPAAHAAQVLSPLPEILPLPQAVQLVAPEPERCPAEQAVQLAGFLGNKPPAENCPPAHAVHTFDTSS